MPLLRMILAGALLTASPLLAQEAKPDETQQDEKKTNGRTFEDKAEAIVRQPVMDLGLLKEKAAPVLLAAQKAPYSRTGLGSCSKLGAAIAELDMILGPDVDAVDENGDPLAGRLAEEGAKSAVGMLIPFRGLVRELTGAAAADRRVRTAIAAGVARRGYLKGVASQKGCRIAQA